MTTAHVLDHPSTFVPAPPAARHLTVVPDITAPLPVAAASLLDALPADLAPSQRTAIHDLLAEVSLADHREHSINPDYAKAATRCWKCNTGGKLGGHHLPDGTVVPIHAKCHRRLHNNEHLCDGRIITV